MVDVTHDRDDRGTRLQVLGGVHLGVKRLFHVGVADAHGLVAEFLDHEFRSVGVDRFVRRHHHAHLHERLDDVGHALGHPVRKLADHDHFGQLHVADLLFGAHRLAKRLGAGLFLLALHRGERPRAAPVATRERLRQRQAAGAAAVVGLGLGLGVAVPGAAGVAAVAVGPARRAGGHALGLGARGGGFGRGAVGGRVGRGLRRDLGFFLGADARLFDLAGLFFFLGAQRLDAFAFLALLRLDLGAAAITFLLAGALLGGAGGDLAGLAGLGGGKRLQPALHLRFGDPGGTLRGVRGDGRGRVRTRCRAPRGTGSGRLGHDDPLALGLDHHVVGAAVAEALLHLARAPTAKTATNTQGFLSVFIAHPFSNPSRQPNCRHARADRSVVRRPVSPCR